MSEEQWTPTFEEPAAMCPRCNWPLAEKRVGSAGADEREQQIRERLAAAERDASGPWTQQCWPAEADGSGWDAEMELRCESGGEVVTALGSAAYVRLLGHAPADIAHLLAENERLRKALQQINSGILPDGDHVSVAVAEFADMALLPDRAAAAFGRATDADLYVALNDLWQSLHEGEDGELFEDFNEERWAQFNAAYAQAGAALVREPVSPASEGDLRRAQRLEVAVHDALEQLDQGMPLLAGVTLLLAVVEAPPAAALGGDRR